MGYTFTQIKDTSADNNNDGFRDDPTGKQLNVLNRFHTQILKKDLLVFDFNYVFDERVYGQNEYISQLYFQRIKIIGVVKQTQKL
ncbi:MAG: hypothetical protein CM15mP129_00190 [Chloroflexota bacterium]|nr:MAG: hypothetical protein CM15mP129_00190 [Chloroflexota bacterium]